jgi:hypothetical protein
MKLFLFFVFGGLFSFQAEATSDWRTLDIRFGSSSCVALFFEFLEGSSSGAIHVSCDGKQIQYYEVPDSEMLQARSFTGSKMNRAGLYLSSCTERFNDRYTSHSTCTYEKRK